MADLLLYPANFTFDTAHEHTEYVMEPLLFLHPRHDNACIYVQEDRLQHFYDVLHYHPEFQLTAYIESKGNLYVGDKFVSFQPGDVVLIGPNLPHVARNTSEYYTDNSSLQAHGISCYFTYESFGSTFFDLPEMITIREMLKRTGRGLFITGDTASQVHPMVCELIRLSGTEKLLLFLRILYILSTSKDLEPIASVGYSFAESIPRNDRLNRVFQYVLRHFSEKITLGAVAQEANMSVASFCRYFKKRTRKTFFEFLNEIRIGHACKLLITQDKSISEICYLCGFNNISNFNRQFKLVTGTTPSRYLEKFKPEKITASPLY